MKIYYRIYYIGGEDGHTDLRLPGVVLNYSDAVDVHDEGLARKLLKLRHFSRHVGPAVVVEDTEYEIRPFDDEGVWSAGDTEVDNDDT
jgi:hypothetical protein